MHLTCLLRLHSLLLQAQTATATAASVPFASSCWSVSVSCWTAAQPTDAQNAQILHCGTRLSRWRSAWEAARSCNTLILVSSYMKQHCAASGLGNTVRNTEVQPCCKPRSACSPNKPPTSCMHCKSTWQKWHCRKLARVKQSFTLRAAPAAARLRLLLVSAPAVAACAAAALLHVAPHVVVVDRIGQQRSDTWRSHVLGEVPQHAQVHEVHHLQHNKQAGDLLLLLAPADCYCLERPCGTCCLNLLVAASCCQSVVPAECSSKKNSSISASG